VSGDWAAQLRQLYEADKAKREAVVEKEEISRQQKQDQVIALLQNSRAHELLRVVQKNLLDGKGALSVYEKPRKYDRAIVLAWQGPISKAQRPNPKSPENYNYILVGVQNGKLWVNNQAINTPTPDILQAALLEAAKNPKTQQRNFDDE